MLELTVREANKLVADMKDSYQRAKEAWKSAIEQSICCGGELVSVKSQLDHGRWLPFLAACDIPPRTASELMRMHENRELLRDKSATTWSDAKRIIHESRSPNRQCTADLNSKPSGTVDAVCIAHSTEPEPKCDCYPHGEHPCICALTAWEVVMAHQFGWIENKTFSEVMQILGKLSAEKLERESSNS